MIHHSVAEKIEVGVFIAIVLGHAGLRLLGKAREARRRPRGELHHPGIFAMMIRTYFLVFIAAIVEWMVAPWTSHLWMSAIGVACCAVSALVQWRAFQDLGKAYSPDIEVRADQPLVENGLYRRLRHPLLSALILELSGITWVLNAPLSFALVLVIFVPMVRARMREEEKVLLQHFGERYRHYQERVGGLWPRVRTSLGA